MRLLFSFLVILFALISLANAKETDCSNNTNGNIQKDCISNKDEFLDPLFLSKYTKRADEFLNSGQYDRAILEYTKILKIKPLYKDPNIYHAVTYINRGKAFFNKEEYDLAIADYTQSIKLNAKDGKAYYSRGNAFKKKIKYQKAIADYSEAILLNPKNIDAYIARGRLLTVSKQYDEAKADFELAISLRPDDDTLYELRGRMYSKMKEYEKALVDYDEALRLNPNNKSAHTGRKLAKNSISSNHRMLKFYNEQILRKPKDSITYYERGNFYYDQGRLDKAIVDYGVAIRLKPGNATLYSNRGSFYYKKGQLEKAKADYDEAIRLNPKNATTYYNRGSVFFKQAQYYKAIADFDLSINLNKKIAKAYSKRGLSYNKIGNYKKALKDLNKALELAPENNEFRTALNKILASKIARTEETKKQKIISSSPKRFALFIGNDSYSNLKDYQQLKKAKNDAQSLADTFEKIGYKTTLGLDLGRSAINKTLDKFANQISPGDEVVFFFAGHGVRIKGRNYLLPSDIPDMSKSSEDYLTTEAIPADRITDLIKNKGARVAMLILDACRNNPFTNNLGRSIGGKRGLAIMTPPEGTFVLFSAGAGQEALDRLSDDDAHPNSVFTRTLIPLLQEDELEIGRLARVVRQKVKKLAETVKHKQTPAVYNEITGDFYLAKK